MGKALPGVEVALAEDGELLVRGGSVMRGYRKEPQKKRARPRLRTARCCAELQAGIDAANARLAKVEHVRAFTVVPEYWEPGSDLLHPDHEGAPQGRRRAVSRADRRDVHALR